MGDYKLTPYEVSAVAAATLAARGVHLSSASDITAKQVYGSASTAEKRCPRPAFLGLANIGVLNGVPPREYGAPGKNAQYAQTALTLVLANQDLANQPRELWRLALQDEDKRYSQQMHVLSAIWRANKLVAAPSAA